MCFFFFFLGYWDTVQRQTKREEQRDWVGERGEEFRFIHSATQSAKEKARSACALTCERKPYLKECVCVCVCDYCRQIYLRAVRKRGLRKKDRETHRQDADSSRLMRAGSSFFVVSGSPGSVKPGGGARLEI
jgi:hypothetical protein